MGVAVCRGGYGASLAFPMSAFARWFAARLVRVFVWVRAHRLLRLRLRGLRGASGCARVGVDGCRDFARGRAPAMSGVSPAWRLQLPRPCLRVLGGFQEMGADFATVLDFCAVFDGGCSLSAPPT